MSSHQARFASLVSRQQYAMESVRHPDEDQLLPRYVADALHRQGQETDEDPPVIPPPLSYWDTLESWGQTPHSDPSNYSTPARGRIPPHRMHLDSTQDTPWDAAERAPSDYSPPEEHDPRSPMLRDRPMGFITPEESIATMLRESLLFQGATIVPEQAVREEVPHENQLQRIPPSTGPRRVRFPSEIPESPTPSPPPVVPTSPVRPLHTFGSPYPRPLSVPYAQGRSTSTGSWTPVIPPRVTSPSYPSSSSSWDENNVKTGSSVPRIPDTPIVPPHSLPAFYTPRGNYNVTPWASPAPAMFGTGIPFIPTQHQLIGTPSRTGAQGDLNGAIDVGPDSDDSDTESDKAPSPSAAPAENTAKGPLPHSDERQDMWTMYAEHTIEQDKETVEAWNDDLDSILIFAALFSAVVTTFVIESSHNLQVDNSAELLRAILLEMKAARNASGDSAGGGLDSGPPVPPAFEVTGSAVRVNAYWFSSLVISLAAALITILAKQWVNYLLAGLSPVPSNGARRRQYRIDGMHKWKLPTVISILPIFLHVSLLLFFVGLVEFVWDLSELVGSIAAALVAATSILYFMANLMAYVYPDCPYKTSVAVFIGQILSLGVAIYGQLAVAIGVAWDLARAAAPLSDARNLADAKYKAQKYDALRILSLRYGEETYIKENSSLIDARILHWLLHNESRLSDSRPLGRILMEFPDLVLHQRLLIDERSYSLLEHFLSSWYNLPYHQLDTDRQRDVLTVVRTLASLESETDIENLPNQSVVPTSHARGFRPSSGFSRPPSSRSMAIMHKASQVVPRLSPTSISLVRRLLGELPALPTSLVAFTLRLGVTMISAPTDGRDWVMVSRGTAILLRRIMSYRRSSGSDETADDELLHAVNSVIFVALHDVEFPEWKLTLPSGRINWLTTLPDLLLRAPVDVVARRQLAWAICTLAWKSTLTEGISEESKLLPTLRVPVNPATPPLLASLARVALSTVHHGHDISEAGYDALNAAVVTLDRSLREWLNNRRGPYSEVRKIVICRELRAIYGPLLLELYRRLSNGEFREEQVLRMLVPMTRVGLSLFLVQPEREDGAYSVLMTTLLCIFRSLVSSRRLPIMQTRIEVLDRSTVHRWIYRAACSLIGLYLDPTAAERASGGSQVLPDLNFHDIHSTTAVALDVVSAVELISKHDIPPYQTHTQVAFLLRLFLGIVKDIFTRNIMLEEGLRGGGNWDWDATRIVADFMQQGGMSILVASPYPPVHTELFAPAVNTLHTIFFGRARPPHGRLFGPATPSDRWHPANELANALIGPYTQFLRTFEDLLRREKFQDVGKEGLLDKVVAIAGYLALYENPSHWPKLDVVLTMQSFFSTLLFARAGRSLYDLRMRMRNPVQALRSKILVPETVAVGLIRILGVISGSGAFSVADNHEHCVECCPTRAQLNSVRARLFGANGWEGWESKSCLWAMTRAILWTIHAIWGGHDRKFMRLRRSLYDHGLAERVRYFQRWDGEIGLLANSMAYRLGGTCRYGDTGSVALLLQDTPNNAPAD